MKKRLIATLIVFLLVFSTFVAAAPDCGLSCQLGKWFSSFLSRGNVAGEATGIS